MTQSQKEGERERERENKTKLDRISSLYCLHFDNIFDCNWCYIPILIDVEDARVKSMCANIKWNCSTKEKRVEEQRLFAFGGWWSGKNVNRRSRFVQLTTKTFLS